MKEIKGFIYYPVSRRRKPEHCWLTCFILTRYHCADSLSVAERDSINQLEALKTDSLKKISAQKDTEISKDSLKKVDELKDSQRISPEEMNRRRTVTPEKKPEQIEVEQHIQQEKIEQRRERQMNQRKISKDVNHLPANLMKRFAAHYLLLPEVGFIRQQVVEIADDGRVCHIFPLTEEIESVEWMPGLIALLPGR